MFLQLVEIGRDRLSHLSELVLHIHSKYIYIYTSTIRTMLHETI